MFPFGPVRGRSQCLMKCLNDRQLGCQTISDRSGFLACQRSWPASSGSMVHGCRLKRCNKMQQAGFNIGVIFNTLRPPLVLTLEIKLHFAPGHRGGLFQPSVPPYFCFLESVWRRVAQRDAELCLQSQHQSGRVAYFNRNVSCARSVYRICLI